MSENPEDAPEHCPGVESQDAGKASACAGCPNQNVCASGEARKPDPDIPKIKEALMNVSHKILVLSGKGGVGKSTVTANLALALSQHNEDDENVEVEPAEVGVLDIDLCGPSIPRILGVMGEASHGSASGYSPVYAADNLCVMSTGFLLGEDEAIILRGAKKNRLIKDLLYQVDWGTLDYLLIDTPPGTSDEHLTITNLLSQVGVSGAIIVTTPQEISLLDVRKQINFCKAVGIPLIGIVENMSMFVCPKCSKSSTIFPRIKGGVEGVANEMNLSYLSNVPLDPVIGKCCDQGKSIFDEHPNSSAVAAYKNLATSVIKFCEENQDFVKSSN